jgi:hypothetical protein
LSRSKKRRNSYRSRRRHGRDRRRHHQDFTDTESSEYDSSVSSPKRRRHKRRSHSKSLPKQPDTVRHADTRGSSNQHRTFRDSLVSTQQDLSRVRKDPSHVFASLGALTQKGTVSHVYLLEIAIRELRCGGPRSCVNPVSGSQELQ